MVGAGNAASALVEFVGWHGGRYTDLLVLCKCDGAWRISGKVYDPNSQN